MDLGIRNSESALQMRELEFRARVETDGLQFCLDLFELATMRLLACKYAYYEMNKEILSDVAYDSSEKDRFIMGRALGLLAEDETSPCIDFNHKHRMAQPAIEFAERYAKAAKPYSLKRIIHSKE